MGGPRPTKRTVTRFRSVLPMHVPGEAGEVSAGHWGDSPNDKERNRMNNSRALENRWMQQGYVHLVLSGLVFCLSAPIICSALRFPLSSTASQCSTDALFFFLSSCFRTCSCLSLCLSLSLSHTHTNIPTQHKCCFFLFTKIHRFRCTRRQAMRQRSA